MDRLLIHPEINRSIQRAHACRIPFPGFTPESGLSNFPWLKTIYSKEADCPIARYTSDQKIRLQDYVAHSGYD